MSHSTKKMTWILTLVVSLFLVGPSHAETSEALIIEEKSVTIQSGLLSSRFAINVSFSGTSLPNEGLPSLKLLALSHSDGYSFEPCELNLAGVPQNESTGAFDAFLECRIAPLAIPVGFYSLKVELQRSGKTFSSESTVTLQMKDSIPREISLELSDDEVFPYKDGYRDDKKIDLAVKGINIDGAMRPVSGTVKVSGGKSYRFKASRVAHIKIATKGLAYGTHTILVTAKRGSGLPALTTRTSFDVKRTFAEDASLSISDNKVFPKSDGYKDSVSFYVASTTSTSKSIKGTGEVKIVSSSGNTVKSWAISNSRARSFTWNGQVDGNIVSGVYLIKYSFKGPEGSVVSSLKRLTVRPERLRKKTIKKNYTAWSAIDECYLGDSFEPCDRGNDEGDPDGIRLYSSGYGDYMLVGGSLPLPSGTKRWRMKFNDIHVSYIAGTYRYMSTNSDWNGSYWQAFPSTAGWDGTTTTDWSKRIGESSAYFIIDCSDWSSLYLTTITVEAEVIKLVK